MTYIEIIDATFVCVVIITHDGRASHSDRFTCQPLNVLLLVFLLCRSLQY
uniref:Uncharacterized protein n=1 Tax=Arion vulgaris TaxID=1028688 RepID=A0A0B7BGE0_9EUPU